ncbi:MAG: TVP38/TMEM64 family protein [Rhodobacteraceae bacterium]|nr:TVP38/TMEM64 family protein [Paracoccaceae bacterium]
MNDRQIQSGLSLKRLLPILVVVAVAVTGFILLRDSLTFETLSDNRMDLIAYRDDNYLLASLVFIGIYVIIVTFSLPGAAIASLTGGFLFGLFPGTLYNVLAATTGAMALFLAARMGLGAYLENKMDAGSATVQKLRKGLKENEISVLFLLRLVPAVPFFVANLLPALVGVRFRNFVLTTFFGIMPGAAVYTWVGAGLGEVFEQGETPNLGIIFEWHILGPILALCALAALPMIIKAIRKKDGEV